MSTQPPAAVPPYAPIQSTSAPPYDAHGKPSDASYRPPVDPGYRPPVDPSYPPPPGATNAAYRPAPQTSGLTYPNGPPPPASTVSYAPPLVVEHPPGPSLTPLPLATVTKPSLKNVKLSTESALREYMTMQRNRHRKAEVGIEERLRIQASAVLGDLRTLRQEVGGMVKSAESHRWRRFIIGGAIATFIPAVRTIFRRPRDEKDSSNDTEYAFRRSRSLVDRIINSVHRPGLMTLAFFVFAVMYVFQNEVTLRVARTVSKRLKKLSSKVERGDEEINEDDLKLLQGWRWRILLWS
ncbi:hypothetical protein OQA88_2266 [Cercophora sp. LCS_1]